MPLIHVTKFIAEVIYLIHFQYHGNNFCVKSLTSLKKPNRLQLNIFSFFAYYFLPIFLFNNCALMATIMVLKLIKTAPMAGPKTNPEEYITPAAKGIATTL